MLQKNKSFWNKKSVLITGINGFIGSNLAQKLEEQGANVWGISRTKTKKNIIKANIVDYSRIDKIIKEKKISICFHLAAESLVESGQEDPYQTFKVNTIGTLNILEITRKNNLEKLIIASTSHVYGNNRLPFKEEYPARPSRPYETSKTCIDLIAQSYAETFNLPVLITRFCNIYGPRDVNFNRLIPKTIKSVLSDVPPLMWGGGALREYMFIDDAVDGYMRLAELSMSRVGKNRIFNFGTGKRFSVQEVIETVIAVSDKNLKINKIKGGRPLEIQAQYVSSSKSKKLLQWSPKVTFKKGLKQTLAWYEKELRK